MKHILVALSTVFLGAGIAYAQAETPGIDQRQANQEQRIDQGIASGQLNQREAARLNTQQEHINKMEDKAKSDGVVTHKERHRIRATQNKASKNIAREKHDRQGKRHQ
jgi:hypothetical protein